MTRVIAMDGTAMAIVVDGTTTKTAAVVDGGWDEGNNDNGCGRQGEGNNNDDGGGRHVEGNDNNSDGGGRCGEGDDDDDSDGGGRCSGGDDDNDDGGGRDSDEDDGWSSGRCGESARASDSHTTNRHELCSTCSHDS